MFVNFLKGSFMLPKIVFNKIMQDIREIKKSWDEDRKENPHIAGHPYGGYWFPNSETIPSKEDFIKQVKEKLHAQ